MIVMWKNINMKLSVENRVRIMEFRKSSFGKNIVSPFLNGIFLITACYLYTKFFLLFVNKTYSWNVALIEWGTSFLVWFDGLQSVESFFFIKIPVFILICLVLAGGVSIVAVSLIYPTTKIQEYFMES